MFYMCFLYASVVVVVINVGLLTTKQFQQQAVKQAVVCYSKC